MSLKFLETITELSREMADLKVRVAKLEAAPAIPEVPYPPDSAVWAQPEPRKRGRPRKVIANG